MKEVVSARENPSAQGEKKKPYSKPRIISGELLETVAATCDPNAGGKAPDDFNCSLGFPSS